MFHNIILDHNIILLFLIVRPRSYDRTRFRAKGSCRPNNFEHALKIMRSIGLYGGFFVHFGFGKVSL